MFFFLTINQIMGSRDWSRPKLKEIWLYKLQDFYELESTHLIF